MGSEVVDDEVNETDGALCKIKNVPIVDLETSRNVILEECIGKSMERVYSVEEEEEEENKAADMKTTVESPPNYVPLNGEPKCNPANPMSYLTGIAQGTFPRKDLSWVRVLCMYSNFGKGLKPDLRMKVWSTLFGTTNKNLLLKDKPSSLCGSSQSHDLSWDRRLLLHSYELSDEILKHYSTTTGEGGGNISLESLAMDINACVHILLPKGGRISDEARTAYLPFAAYSCSFLLTLLHLLGDKKEEEIDVKDQVVTILTQIFRHCSLISPLLMTTKVQNTSHKQFYFLASYHSPHLVQHLDRFCPGWELPAGDTGCAVETLQRKNTHMTCLLNELEHSVMPHLDDHNAIEPDTLPLQRRMDNPFMSSDFCEEHDNNVGLIPHSMLGVLCLNVLRLGCSPSMLAPLWDYFVISGSKHKGYFLLLALLLREKEQLLALEEEQLQSHLKDVLSGSGLVSSLKDASKLDPLLKEVRDLDWQTPESFCHFVNEAVMQTAVAEYSRLHDHSRVPSSNIFESCHEMPHPTKGPPAGYPAPSFDIDFEMNLPSMFVTESKVATLCEPQNPLTTTTSTEGVTAKTTVKASKGSTIVSRIATAASQAVIGVNQRRTTFLSRIRRNKPLSSADGNKELPHNIPQICLYCTPHEMIISIGLKIGSLSANDRDSTPFGTTPSDRMSYDMYFPIDCRSETARSNGGWFKDIFHFDSESVENQHGQQLVLKELQPILGNKHICLMGEGEKKPHHYEDGNQQQFFFRAAEEDCERVNAFAVFLMKNGFSHVSVVHGGFAAVHGDLASEQIPGMSLSILTDHSPSLCDLCKHCCPELVPRTSFTFSKSK